MKKYLIITFGISWIIMIVASLSAEKLGLTFFQMALVVVMLVPTIGALLTGHKLSDFKWKPVFKGRIRYWLMAWLLPIATTILGAALFFVIFPKAFDLSGAYLSANYGEEVLQQLKDAGMTPAIYVLITAAAAVTYGTIANVFPSLGEEIGWRGVMTPYFKEKYGKKGIILSGAIWGVWHWPLIIFAGYEYGYGYFGAPITGILLFCLICIALGISLEYVYDKTDCIFAPALMHGSFNAIGGVAALVLNPAYANYVLLGPLPVGIIAAIPMIAVATYLLFKKG